MAPSCVTRSCTLFNEKTLGSFPSFKNEESRFRTAALRTTVPSGSTFSSCPFRRRRSPGALLPRRGGHAAPRPRHLRPARLPHPPLPPRRVGSLPQARPPRRCSRRTRRPRGGQEGLDGRINDGDDQLFVLVVFFSVAQDAQRRPEPARSALTLCHLSFGTSIVFQIFFILFFYPTYHPRISPYMTEMSLE